MNEPGTSAHTLVTFGDDQLGADRRGPAHHRLVRRIIPFHRIPRLDAVLASHLAQPHETNAGLTFDARAQPVDGIVLEFRQIDEQRVGNRVKQFERSPEGAGHLDGLRQSGLLPGFGIADREKDSAGCHVCWPDKVTVPS